MRRTLVWCCCCCRAVVGIVAVVSALHLLYDEDDDDDDDVAVTTRTHQDRSMLATIAGSATTLISDGAVVVRDLGQMSEP
jgi:uncharacterized membrane protein